MNFIVILNTKFPICGQYMDKMVERDPDCKSKNCGKNITEYLVNVSHLTGK